ncbi:hypothetical protein CYMTET_37550 [Cymbomonas tetramitiformis]|uniref:Very-long-chain 3-oxoacyl-CoA synthase n=1 Tax=Cymbomonas tetramitiformis TaxID=36881 RepID=A0AAE0CF13_9CHLO|nr:hypothetical protein CYMTET_37550 [Cymbomonas tetramitiformis]
MEQVLEADKMVADFIFKGFEDLGWKIQPISPATAELPLVVSPAPLLASLLGYFIVVAVGLQLRKAFPRDTSKPDSFLLKSLIVFHNVFLVSLSAYMCGGVLYQAWANGYSFWGNAYDASQTEMAKVIYIFYVSKLYEFMDTFIMLMKGNINQVSFLHVYHHGSISLIWWVITYHAPGGDAYFSAALNSWVHVCMYMYYLIAICLPKDAATKRKYLWWGRYLTQMQMFQFFMNFLQAIYCLLFSPYPKFMSQVLLVYMVTLLMLFGHFYYKKHVAAAKAKKDKMK